MAIPRFDESPDGPTFGRRGFLRLGGACLLGGWAGRAEGQAARPLLPRVNGAINIQPVRRLDPDSDAGPLIEPGLVALQLRAVYELGFQRIRITLPYGRFGPDFLASIPYVRAARALGIEVLGVLADFSGFDLAQALARSETRDPVLDAYLEIFGRAVEPVDPSVACGELTFQVFNEPTHFLGISPRHYVEELLRPTYLALKARRPGLRVAAAAPIGNVDGYLRVRAMLEAGLERWCDRVAYHVYSRNLIPLLAGLARRPVWVTESGADGTARHLEWFTEVFAEIETRLPEVLRIYYFQLYDRDAGRFRLIDVVPRGEGAFDVVPESSDLIGLLLGRVERATGGEPRASFEQLVPDVSAYFPDEADLRVIAEASAL